MQSKKYTLNKADLQSIGRGLLITLAGALVTYLIEVLPQIDLGEYGVFIVPIAALLLNTARKYLAGK